MTSDWQPPVYVRVQSGAGNLVADAVCPAGLIRSQYLTAEHCVIVSAPHGGRARDLPRTEPSPSTPFLFWKGVRGFWGAQQGIEEPLKGASLP